MAKHPFIIQKVLLPPVERDALGRNIKNITFVYDDRVVFIHNTLPFVGITEIFFPNKKEL